MFALRGQIEYIFSDKTGTLTCNEVSLSMYATGSHANLSILDGVPAMLDSGCAVC